MPKTHGLWRRPEYRVWQGMKARCQNPNEECFGRYGGRGISVCAEWQTDFVAFLEHVGPRPSPAHQLDRIDNEGDYEPGNVRWATPHAQARNRRTNIMLTYKGKTACLKDLVKDYPVKYHTARWRYNHGWPLAKVLNDD